VQASPRVRTLVDVPINSTGAHVLYWMTAARRTRSSYALDRAIAWARELGKPLWVLEALRLGHPHASARQHAFVVRGMGHNAARFKPSPIGYYAYVEPRIDAGRGLLEAFARKACVVVTDDWPVYFLRNMTRAAAGQGRRAHGTRRWRRIGPDVGAGSLLYPGSPLSALVPNAR
jgi:deoxyribodipyrimidine photo-lyase